MKMSGAPLCVNRCLTWHLQMLGFALQMLQPSHPLNSCGLTPIWVVSSAQCSAGQEPLHPDDRSRPLLRGRQEDIENLSCVLHLPAQLKARHRRAQHRRTRARKVHDSPAVWQEPLNGAESAQGPAQLAGAGRATESAGPSWAREGHNYPRAGEEPLAGAWRAQGPNCHTGPRRGHDNTGVWEEVSQWGPPPRGGPSCLSSVFSFKAQFWVATCMRPGCVEGSQAAEAPWHAPAFHSCLSYSVLYLHGIMVWCCRQQGCSKARHISELSWSCRPRLQVPGARHCHGLGSCKVPAGRSPPSDTGSMHVQGQPGTRPAKPWQHNGPPTKRGQLCGHPAQPLQCAQRRQLRQHRGFDR